MEMKNIVISVVIFGMILGVLVLFANGIGDSVGIQVNVSSDYNQIANIEKTTGSFGEEVTKNPIEKVTSLISSAGDFILSGMISAATGLTSLVSTLKTLLSQLAIDLGIPDIIVQGFGVIISIIVLFGIYRLIKTGY